MTVPKHNPLPGVPSVESPFFEDIFAQETSAEFMSIARSLHEEGYAIIDFPEVEFDTLTARIIDELDDGYDWARWHDNPMFTPRIMDAWQFHKAVHRLAVNQAIIDLLSKLYGRRAFPFQTLNFPVGTQQHFHTDSIHFASMPERYMCGVWVAFEDVDENNGPLEYYPKSHKLPIYSNEAVACTPSWQDGSSTRNNAKYFNLWSRLIEQYQLERQELHLRKGQAVIWAANLLHGGAPQKDLQRTRQSQVTHYFFENCAYYTPVMSIPFLGSVAYRGNLVNVATKKPVKHQIGELQIPDEFIQQAASAGKRFSMQQMPLSARAQAEFQYKRRMANLLMDSKLTSMKRFGRRVKGLFGFDRA
ncbi:MAG: phytanoyl-CoA dioxygenase family protein [Pseudomonadota bacterium]